MSMWLMILGSVITLFVISVIFICSRIQKFFTPIIHKQTWIFSVITFFILFDIIVISIDLVNAIVCTLYLALIWIIADILGFCLRKHISKKHYYTGWAAIITTFVILTIGWYLNHNVWQTTYDLTTQKEISNIKIAMFADSHIGTTFNADGFAKHMAVIQQQKPDLLVIAGDFIDDNTTKQEMIKSIQALGKIKTKYGIYFVFGNHDKGYYGSARRGFDAKELVHQLQTNGIVVLRDEAILIDQKFYLIGRRDFSEIRERGSYRKSMNELTKDLDPNKYMIVIDHQPADYDNQVKSGVDLVLSGHTHGGQLFPLNQVGKWIGANDLVYGHEHRNNTDFIVTSGISDWAIKFKTGTKSEFIIINIRPDKH